MLTAQQLQMFDAIARGQPRFRDWLIEELAKQHQILVQHGDDVQVRRAQGYAQCLNQLISQLDDAKKRA